MFSHLSLEILFVVAVTLIWFMLAYQCALFFLGHLYYRRSRGQASQAATVPDSELPCISVLVPCHNEEVVLAHTLRALLALDYPTGKLEILVIDDGSTDRTAEVASEFTRDDRIRLLSVPSAIAARGKAGALNFGLEHARHPVLAVYDADNMPETGALRLLAAHLVRDPRLGAVIGMYRAWNRHRSLLVRFVNLEGIGFQWILQAGRWMLMRLNTLPGTNYVIHKALVEKLGGWDEQALTEDFELSIRIYQAGYHIQFLPASVTWEQEPEKLAVWFRQRRRWVRGSNYIVRRHGFNLLRTHPRRIGVELLYSLLLYYFFFLAVVISDVLFLLGAAGLITINVPGPYTLVWVFAYSTFVLQLVIALTCVEGEDSGTNILLTLLMYFTYCQLWLPVVAAAFYDDFIARREIKWAKTQRFDMDQV
jgi:cellulose synthase/poly-beta-1,6-N-acetylglucosamine synthase-like glycosyltransferase